MTYYVYSNSTGALIEKSEDLLYDGCPPTGLSVTFTNLTIAEIDTLYTWDAELRDFVPNS